MDVPIIPRPSRLRPGRSTFPAVPIQSPPRSAVDRLWLRLRTVKRVVFEVGPADGRAEGRRDGEMEWVEGAAEGVVEWLSGRPQEITWRERGEWTAGPMQGTRFSSAYAWHRRADDTIAVSHLRFGADRPVPLVELVAAGHDRWASAAPHHCADDRYAVEVELGHDGVTTVWTVTGPTTGYVLRARYLTRG